MTRQIAPTDRALRWYAEFIRRHLIVIAAGASLGFGAAVGLLVATDPVYDSTATVVVAPLPSSEDRPSRTLSIDSDAQLLTSTRVLHAAADAVDHPGGATALQRQVRVRAVPTSSVLRITVRDADPARAHAAARAVSEQFLAARESTAAARQDAIRTAFEIRVADVSNRLAVQQTFTAGETDDALGDSAPEHALVVEQSRLQRQLAALAANRPDPGFVSDPPRAPTEGHRPTAPAMLASGILLGLLAGATVGWLRDGVLALRLRRRPFRAPSR